MMRTGTWLVVGLLLAATASACGEESAGSKPQSAPYTLPVHDVEIPTDQVSWAHERTLYLGKRELDLGRPVNQYVLTPHSIVFTDTTGALWSSDGASAPVQIAEVGPTRLVVSPDGGHLGFIDFEHGAPDRDGDSKAQVVVFDTASGKQLIRDSRHISDSKELGQAELFEEGLPEVVGFADGGVYAGDATTPSLFPLDGSEPKVVDGLDDPQFPGAPSYGRPVEVYQDHGVWKRSGPDRPDPGDLGVESPDGDLVVLSWPDALGALVVDLASGKPRPMDLKAEEFRIGGWQGPTRFYGFARAAGVATGRLVSCDAATGSCDDLRPRAKATEDKPILFNDNGNGLE